MNIYSVAWNRKSTFWLEPIGWAGLLLLAFWLRLPHFRSLALQFDEVEYAYCVEAGVLPHSPYLFFLWVGYLLRHFVSLDWGYSALSMVSSLLSIPLFALIARSLTSSKTGGWVSGMVLALAPISIEFAGRQEIYPFQFLLLSGAWYLGILRKKALLSGLLLGATFATHNGTLFALPATLLLFAQAWRKPREKPVFQAADGMGLGPGLETDGPPRDSIFRRGRRWAFFGLGFAFPVALVVVWLTIHWFHVYGSEDSHLLLRYLRGSAPTPDFAEFLKGGPGHDNPGFAGVGDRFGDQLERIWADVGDVEVFARGLALCGMICLALMPWRVALPWWLLPLPFLIYEIGVGWTIDKGIYSVFILPTLAVGFAHSATFLVARGGAFLKKSSLNSELRTSNLALRTSHFELRKTCLTLLHLGVFLGGFVSAAVNLPAVQDAASYRSLQPWLRKDGSTMALAQWVRENAPTDTIVMAPVEWYYCGLAVPYYANRIPLFRDGYLLNPVPGKPIYAGPDFDYLKMISTEDLARWVDEERPLVCFDSDPFTSFGALWTNVDVSGFEARPILWLDRNQSGTSLAWKEPQILCHIEPLSKKDRNKWGANVSSPYPLSATEMPLFRPTLYCIARKGDPWRLPGWALALQEKAPEDQRGVPPSWKGGGCLFADSFAFYSDAVPGKDHVVRIVVDARGCQYVVRCESKCEGEWLLAAQDMEKYVLEPQNLFVDMYFRIPAGRIKEDAIKIRLSPGYGTPYVNLYLVEVAAVDSP